MSGETVLAPLFAIGDLLIDPSNDLLFLVVGTISVSYKLLSCREGFIINVSSGVAHKYLKKL